MPWRKSDACILFVWAYILFAVGPALSAEFGVIDDHQLMRLFDRESHLSLGELPGLLLQEAIPPLGRFRPAFHMTQAVEVYVFQDRVRLWLLARLALALATGAALYAAGRTWVNPVAAALAAVLFFSGPQSEVWYRLGEGETYGDFLTALGVWALARRVGSGDWRPLRCAPGLLALALAGWYKESFIPLLPAALVFLYVLVPGRGRVREFLRSLTWGDWTFLGLLAASAAALCAGVLTMTAVHGHVYGGHWSVGQTTDAALRSLARFTRDTAWYAPTAAVVLIALLARLRPGLGRGHLNQNPHETRSYRAVPGVSGASACAPSPKREARARGVFLDACSPLLRASGSQVTVCPSGSSRFQTDFGLAPLIGSLVAAAVLLLLPQWMFYGSMAGAMKTDRYLTPANGFVVAAVLCGLWRLDRLAALPTARALRVIVVVVLLATALRAGSQTHDRAAAYARTTRAFQAHVARILELQALRPEAPIVFHVCRAGDFEPVYSLRQFLATRLHRDVQPQLLFDPREPGDAAPGGLSESLAKTARNGGSGFHGGALPAAGAASVEVLFATAPPSGVAEFVVALDDR